MAFTRKKRKRTTRRRTFKGRGRRKMMTFGRRVKRIIMGQEEKKFIVLDQPLLTDFNTFNAFSAPLLSIGTSRAQRVGSKVTMRDFTLNITCAAGSVGGLGVTGVPCRLRILIVRDSMCNGAFPIAGLSSLMIDPVLANQYYSLFNPSTVGPRYHIIWDKILTLKIEGGATDQAPRVMLRKRFKLNQVVTYFDLQNTGTISDIVKNNLLIMATSDQTGLTTPSLGFEAILRYTDI